MSTIEISNETPGDKLRHLAQSIHRATGGLPVALKSRDKPGVFVDRDGSTVTGYQSRALDSVFGDASVASDTDVKKVRVDDGKYAGIPMVVSPILDDNGLVVAAIGVVDDLGTISLQEFAEISEFIRQQVIRGP